MLDIQPPETLKEIEYAENGDVIMHHAQDTGLINYNTQLIKENTDRGFTDGRMFQQFMRIPALDYVKLTAQRPELRDPNLMEKYVRSHEECHVWLIGENKRLSGQGMQLIVK